MSTLTIDLINRQVFSALKEHTTIRIVGILPTHILNTEDYITSVSNLLESFISIWKEKDQKTQLLAVDAWTRYTFCALDINNWGYDYETAHKQLTPVPVYILILSRHGDNNRWRFYRRAVEDERVAGRIAELHYLNDRNPVPFFENHVDGNVPVYCSCRDD